MNYSVQEIQLLQVINTLSPAVTDFPLLCSSFRFSDCPIVQWVSFRKIPPSTDGRQRQVSLLTGPCRIWHNGFRLYQVYVMMYSDTFNDLNKNLCRNLVCTSQEGDVLGAGGGYFFALHVQFQKYFYNWCLFYHYRGKDSYFMVTPLNDHAIFKVIKFSLFVRPIIVRSHREL